VAPNGRVDVAYQAQRAVNRSSSGTGNARIDSFFVSKPAGGAWTAPLRVSSASSDPAASAQNNLQLQFMGDYNTLVSTADRAFFVWTDTRGGSGCPAVDAYQRYLIDNGIVAEEDREAEAKPDPRLEAAEASAKPTPPTDCASTFGNSDIRAAVIVP
jgi:hypothetical protein